jgi:CheY-like chemotaxis protein
MKTILLIDDEQEVRTVYARVLRKDGYHVIEADSGSTGLEMARTHLPDLILCDVNMPGGDGATLLYNIRHDPELRSRQVVLMTGKPDMIAPRKAMDDGADDYLQKPFGLDALKSCVKARFSRASISWRVEEQMLAQLRASVPPQLPHEFFTPLAGIIGLMEILRSSTSTFTPEEVADIHNDVYSSAQRLHHTLRNYLLILELQTASQLNLQDPLTPREVEEAISAGVNAALQLNNRQDDVNMEISARPILAKREDLTLMVEELVDNACKFSRQGTPIKVSMGADGCMSITDEGRGMTGEEIVRIGAFQQFDRKKNEQQGLGLGLVLVVKLAALGKAMFSISSQPGKGTRVLLSFPFMRVPDGSRSLISKGVSHVAQQSKGDHLVKHGEAF